MVPLLDEAMISIFLVSPWRIIDRAIDAVKWPRRLRRPGVECRGKGEPPVKLDVGMLTHDLKTLPRVRPPRWRRSGSTACGRRRPSTIRFFCRLAVAATATSRIKLGTSIAVGGSPPQARWSWPTSPGIWPRPPADASSWGLGSQVKGHNERRFSVKWEGAGAADARGRPGAARDLGLAGKMETKLNFKGAVLPVRSHGRHSFSPGPDRASPGTGLRRRRESCDVPHRRRGVRRPCTCIRSTSPKISGVSSCRPAVTEGLAKSGRRPERFHLRHPRASWFVGDTEAEAGAGAPGSEAADSLFLRPPPAPTSRCWPLTAGRTSCRTCTASQWRGDWKGMADLITDEMVDVYAVTGTHDDVGRKLRERYAGLPGTAPRSISPGKQPTLDDPRLPRLVKEFQRLAFTG